MKLYNYEVINTNIPNEEERKERQKALLKSILATEKLSTRLASSLITMHTFYSKFNDDIAYLKKFDTHSEDENAFSINLFEKYIPNIIHGDYGALYESLGVMHKAPERDFLTKLRKGIIKFFDESIDI